ncbi:MAG: hypothetical protein JXJ17_09140 [Anaerolineae bacterium]|nr:hypothetical protein [Anaerolineae bacterium]
MPDKGQLARALEVKNQYEGKLMAHPDVVGVGVGLRQRGGEYTDEVCIVVMVKQKHPLSALDAERVLPTSLDGVPVDVQAVGEIREL